MKHSNKQPKDLTIRLYKSTAALPADWDDLLPPNHFLKKESLHTSEAAQLPHTAGLYLLMFRKNEPVAAGFFQVLKFQKEHLNEETNSRIALIGWQLFLTVARPKMLIAGHLFRHDVASFFVKETTAPFDAFRMLQTMIREAQKTVCAQAILVKDVAPALVDYFSHYEPRYILLRNDISMEMELPPEWETMADYAKALKHKYAQRYRKVRAAWEALTIRELNVEETFEQQETIYQLYRQVSMRQSVRLGDLSAAYLPLLKKQYPEALKIWMAFEGETPVAFFSGWAREKVFDMFYIGFDYSRNDALQLYFNILFFSIEQAILLKKEKLILGRTALEAKARLGCKPQYLSTFLFIQNPLLRRAVGNMQTQAHGKEGEWENRHPFKGN